MSSKVIGTQVPNIALAATDDKMLNLSEFKGQKLVIYFYPKDSTPGCTTEGQNFRDRIDEFTAKNTVVLGVSKDTVRSHNNFKCKQNFPFDLISDTDEVLCNFFDVIKPKKMYGKEFIGIERSTFIVDEEGIVRTEWRKVKVADHVNEVLSAL